MNTDEPKPSALLQQQWSFCYPQERLILPATRLTVFSPPGQKPSKTIMLRSGEVETVEVHDFVPYRYKVVQELLLGVLACVDFRQRPELGVRTED